MRKKITDYGSAERRKFERIDIAFNNQVLVLDGRGKKVGTLLQLGRGGFMMQTEKLYPRDGKPHIFVIHEQEEDIQVRINARVRYSDQHGTGLEFVGLDAESAVEIGIIIGKYYEAQQTRL